MNQMVSCGIAKIMQLDVSFHRQGNQDGHFQDSLKNHTKKIVELAKEGFDLDYISESLVIPKEEVMLVLDLKKKISQLDSKEGVS